ncbi:POK8 protein, partial [Chionis minor]|nr:POK8 protein [Chionis minor]
PWKYLGWILVTTSIKPQPLTINNDIKTLNDVQKLMGTINWVQPVMGIATHKHLFD